MDERLYQKNMAALEQGLPELYQQLLAVKLGTDYLAVDNAAGGGKGYNLYCKSTEKFWYGFDAGLDAAEKIRQLKIKNARFAVLFGIGLGHELDYFITEEQEQNQTFHLVIIEKELEIFKWSLYFFDYAPFLKKSQFTLCIGKSLEEMTAYLTDKLRSGFKNVHFYLKTLKALYHSSALSWFKDYYLEALRRVKEATYQIIVLYGDAPDDSLLGLKNMLLNLGEIVNNPGINLLYDKFKGKPGIVVATGPSLNKNKHLLKGLEDKALIVAADASLRVLLPMGVRPHIVTSLERIENTSRLFENLPPEEEQDTWLAACPVVPPLTYELYHGPRLVVYRNFAHFKWLELDKGTLNTGASGANMAFKICEVLGCDPIILIGQDLAYSKDGQASHAKGHLYGEDSEVERDLQKMMVKANDGGMIKTHEIWNLFRTQYEIDVLNYPGTCINSTEGGAFIAGTKVQPFQQSIDEHIQENIYPLKVIREAIAAFSADKREADKAQVLSFLREGEADFLYMIERLETGLQRIARAKNELLDLKARAGSLTRKDRKDIAKLEEKIKEPWQKLEGRHKTYQGLLAHTIQSYYIKRMNDIHAVPDRYDDFISAVPEQLLLHEEMYARIKALTEISLSVVREAIERFTSEKEGSDANV